MKHLQIIYYDSNKHVLGPFNSLNFVCITQSIPSNGSVTVTCRGYRDDDTSELITVPAETHSIEPV